MTTPLYIIEYVIEKALDIYKRGEHHQAKVALKWALEEINKIGDEYSGSVNAKTDDESLEKTVNDFLEEKESKSKSETRTYSRPENINQYCREVWGRNLRAGNMWTELFGPNAKVPPNILRKIKTPFVFVSLKSKTSLENTTLPDEQDPCTKSTSTPSAHPDNG